MLVTDLITKLEKTLAMNGDVDVIIDFDDNGYYEVENVGVVYDDGNALVNLISSNEQ